MLPIHEVNNDDVPDQGNRNNRWFFIGLALFFFIIINSSSTQTEYKPTEIDMKCTSAFYEQEVIKYLMNNTSVDQDCYYMYLIHVLANQHYTGVYGTGLVQLHFWQSTNYTALDVRVAFSESEYLDDNQISFEVVEKLTDLIIQNQANQISINSTALTHYGNLYDMNYKYCSTNITLVITNVTNPKILFKEQAVIQVLTTSECFDKQIFNSETIHNAQDHELQAIGYSFLNTTIGIICMLSGLKILKQIFDGEENTEEYSIITIGLLALYDNYLAMFNFFIALGSEVFKYVMQQLFQYFITPSFLFFVLFSIFEVRLVALIWRNRLNAQADFRRESIKFNCALYFCLIFGNYILFKYIVYPWMTLIITLFFIPQIVHQAIKGQFVKLNLKYTLGYAFPKIILIFYFRGYPHNLFAIKPMPMLLFMITIMVAIQFIIHYLQHKLGPQFFVPVMFLPKKYNYFMAIPDQFDLEIGPSSEFQFLFQEECAVCMAPLHHQPSLELTEMEQSNFMIRQVVSKSKGNIMKTPCDHRFHVVCLAKWMAIRLTCPSCRQSLPPL